MSKVPLAICPQRSFAEDLTVLRPMLGVWECLSSQMNLAPNSQLGCLVQTVEKCWHLKLHNISEAKIGNMHQNAFYISWLFVNLHTFFFSSSSSGSPVSSSGFMEVVSFKLAALRKPFEARDDLTLTMKIARASQRQKTGAEKPGITGSGSRVFWAKKNNRGQGCSQWVAQGYTRGCGLRCIRTPQQGELQRFGRLFWDSRWNEAEWASWAISNPERTSTSQQASRTRGID